MGESAFCMWTMSSVSPWIWAPMSEGEVGLGSVSSTSSGLAETAVVLARWGFEGEADMIGVWMGMG